MMAEAVKTIEQMIAEWYASGVRSDECFYEITRQMEPIVRSITRGFDRRLADEVCSGAVGHVVAALQSDVNQGVPGKSYDPTRPFAAWCYTVVGRYAISEWRRQWHKRTKNTPPTHSGDDLLDRFGDDAPGPEKPALMREASQQMRAEFERILKRPEDRIIVAVQTGYIDGLPDDVVAAWCDEADVAVSIDALRSIVEQSGPLKAIADILDLSHDVVRARASRAKKDLAKGGFGRFKEDFE
jgi:DNA-directed RNA polymerase specialized sigma24 family protein